MQANTVRGQRSAPVGWTHSDKPSERGSVAQDRPSALGRRARRFARDEGGAVTVEALLWIPFFFWIVMLITDASLAFFAKAEAFRIVQNGNRLYSISADVADTEAELEAWVESAYSGQSTRAAADTTFPSSGTVVQTAMTVPLVDVMLFNVFGASDSWTMTVNSQHYIEWPN